MMDVVSCPVHVGHELCFSFDKSLGFCTRCGLWYRLNDVGDGVVSLIVSDNVELDLDQINQVVKKLGGIVSE